MHIPSVPLRPSLDEPETSEGRWVLLVTELKGRLPAMQKLFVERVQAIAGYSGDSFAVEELENSAVVSIGLILNSMAGEEHYPRMVEFATGLGARRARQGVAAEALMSAVRLDFPIIWSTLLRLSTPADASLMASRAEDVWRVVDDYASAIHSSYLSTRVAMAQQEAGVKQEFISALFSAQGRHVETRERFARAFDVNADAQYAIAAGKGQRAEELRKLAAFPTPSNPIFLHESADYTYVFWPITELKFGTQDALPTGVATIPCGVAVSADGLMGLASAARVAAALSELAKPTDHAPVTVDKHWARLARTRLDETGVDLRALLELQLGSCRVEELERLRETVTCFLLNGNVAVTAETLFCHRNTILNRLRRFKEVTGIDLTVPAEIARVVIAWA